VHVTDAAPTVPHTTPVPGDTDTRDKTDVDPEGIVSEIDTFDANPGPKFLIITVYCILSPGTTDGDVGV